MAKTKQFRKKRLNKRTTKRKMIKGGMPIVKILITLFALGMRPVNAFSTDNVKSAAIGVGVGRGLNSARNAVKNVQQNLQRQNDLYKQSGGAFAIDNQITISWGDLTSKIGIDEAMKLTGRTGRWAGAPSTLEIQIIKFNDAEKYEEMLNKLEIEETKTTPEEKKTIENALEVIQADE